MASSRPALSAIAGVDRSWVPPPPPDAPRQTAREALAAALSGQGVDQAAPPALSQETYRLMRGILMEKSGRYADPTLGANVETQPGNETPVGPDTVAAAVTTSAAAPAATTKSAEVNGSRAPLLPCEEYCRLRQRLLDQRAARIAAREKAKADAEEKTGTPDPLSPSAGPAPIRPFESHDDTAYPGAFLNEAGLQRLASMSAPSEGSSDDHVQVYLAQLNLPKLVDAYGGRSRCTTVTQDTDLSSELNTAADDQTAVDDDVSDEDDGATRADPAAAAELVRDLHHDTAVSAEYATTPAGGSIERGASSFLFAAAPIVVAASIGEITCAQFNRPGAMAQAHDTRSDAASTAVDTATSGPDTAKSTLACGTVSGAVVLFEGLTGRSARPDMPPVVLRGHTDRVTDLWWGDDPRMLLTVGQDAVLIMWDARRREKLRQLPTQYAPRVARFLPRNNNFCVVGLDAPIVRVYNLSTGIAVKKVKMRLACTAMAIDDVGAFVIAGDAGGEVSAFATHMEAAVVRRVAVQQLDDSTETSSIAWQAGWDRRPAQGSAEHAPGDHGQRVDFVAVNTKANAVTLLGLVHTRRGGAAVECGLHALRRIQLPAEQATGAWPLRSVFCARGGGTTLTVATGAEDGCVHLVSVGAGGRNTTAALLSAGYPCVVLLAAWDEQETLLVAGTDSGEVLVWRRLQLDAVTDPTAFPAPHSAGSEATTVRSSSAASWSSVSSMSHRD